MRAAYGDHYNRAIASPGAPIYRLATRLRRFAQIADVEQFDVVFLQRPAFPFTAIVEHWIAKRNPHTIFDVDDAIWMGPTGPSELRRQVFDANVRYCKHLIVGNKFLHEKAGHPDKTSIIPTVIDTDRFVPATRRSPNRVVIGWMGTASNFPSLRSILPAIRTVLAQHPSVVFRVISNQRLVELENHGQIEQLPWRADAEIQQLQAFDIGLMPLIDTEASRGKCGFKMIQYMAVGCPVIVSPVGANLDILVPGTAGSFAVEHDGWVEALIALLSGERRAIMGAAGRARAINNYSIKAVVDQYIGIFNSVAA